ncbi:lipopolysaccharide biosynthesis protein [Acetobacterium sp. UBA5834]|jgi:O-antigen/teichoic acid export membrane protein|uniref:lipopolysaccharide biosynthesis protein n=1 Tax=Acetobacterium sp. UBA5834 TaxID=1945907 RepID=UPI00257F8815|nr:lipopolysaccharide biosynthesis protein [Acetobacterium sp. UBA5834]
MDDKQIKSKVISSLFWKFMERLGTQGIQFVVQIVLARLILPEEYGTIALIAIFISFANVFVQYGFNTALIQKQDANETDFSSVFFLSLVVAGVCYVILFISAPLIAEFFENPMLIPLLRVLSTTLFLGGLNSIQNAVVARNLEFKKLFYSSLGAVVGSGIIGIVMAYNGFGAWALVAQQLTNQLMVAGILWFTVKWRPGFLFSLESLKGLFSFGWKLLVSALINMLYNNVQSLFIAKIYNPAMLGYFNRGQQFPSLIVSNINGSIQSVMFPALALKQDNRQRVKEMVRRAIVTSAFFIFPMMVGLAVIAEPLVTILLTDKWLPCVPFLQISCAAFALLPIHTANLQAINALGRSDIFLKLEIIKNVVSLAILGVSLAYGIYAIAAGMFFSSVASSFINAYPNKKLLDYSYVQQLKDVMPSLLLSLAMGGIIYCFLWLNMSPLITLTLQVGVGICIYFGIAKLLKFECLTYLMVTAKEMLDNRRKRE